MGPIPFQFAVVAVAVLVGMPAFAFATTWYLLVRDERPGDGTRPTPSQPNHPRRRIPGEG
jgi:hypothetical protein